MYITTIRGVDRIHCGQHGCIAVVVGGGGSGRWGWEGCCHWMCGHARCTHSITTVGIAICDCSSMPATAAAIVIIVVATASTAAAGATTTATTTIMTVISI